MSRGVCRRLGVLLLGLALLCACGRPPEAAIDLARELERALVATDTAEIRFVQPGSADLLDFGWVRRATKVRWARYPASQVRFFATQPRPLSLRLRARGAPCLEGRPQRVSLVLNGMEQAELELAAEYREHRVEVGADAVLQGWNELRLAYATECDPDRSRVAAGWDYLIFENAAAPAQPRSEVEPPTLLVPFGSEVSFYLDLEGASRLVIEEITAPVGLEGSGGSLVLEVQSAERSEADSMELLSGAARVERVDIGLDVGSGGPTRVSLRAFGGGSRGGPRGFRLLRPEVRTMRQERAAGPPIASAVERGSETRPGIVLYLVDTLRADHLGVFGYPRPTSPYLDAFAADATVFDRALAQASWTRPAIASIFTGLNPQVHAVIGRDDGLAPTFPTLAELLSEAGYDTFGVTTNANVAKQYGFSRGFDEYRFLPYAADNIVHQPSEEVNRLALEWLDRRDSDRPFFLFLHTMDPHGPYRPPEEFRRRFDAPLGPTDLGTSDKILQLRRKEARGESTADVVPDVRALYDAEIAYNDANFGVLLDELRERGLYESSLIIFLSDHGEAFGEKGEWAHGTSLYGELVDIPLVVRFPDGAGAGTRVGRLSQQIDILPTVLDLLGIEFPEGTQGRSLLPDVGTLGSESERTLGFAHSNMGGIEVESVIADDWKLIRYLAGRRGVDGLFLLSEDPNEANNLLRIRPVWRGFLDSELELSRRSWQRGEAVPVTLTDEQKRQLRAIGYVQ